MGKISMPFLGETNSFAEAFPEITSIHIEYAETEGKRQECIANPSRFAAKMKCGNTRCKGGWFNLEHEILMMVLQRLEKQEAILYCTGKEGSHPKAPPCPNILKLIISITYKE